VGGSLIGGSNTNAGRIFSIRAMGAVKIGGNIEGGSGLRSGQLATDSTLDSLRLGGSLLGGSEDSSGNVRSAGAMGAVKIRGNIEGGDIGAPGTLSDTGFIEARRIASLVVSGSIISGSESGGGTLINSGAVRVGADLGPITIKGSLIGNATNPVLITARGQDTPGATTDTAIKSLTVGGRVEFADILAGYNTADVPVGVNADARIGRVVIGTDWIASNLLAGVQDDGSPQRDDPVGDNDDQKITGGTDTAERISKIASILIKGQALGTVGPGDHFGFLAQHIGSFKIGPTVFTLQAGVGNDLPGLPIGVTGAPAGDLRVREVTP
jgi:hypothetical protein